MSDEEFDQDLRSVLVEDAPRDVPDDLRRRVAAVSAIEPQRRRLSGPAWRSPLRLSFAVLAGALVVLAVGLWRSGPSAQPGVGGDPSASPSVASSASPAAMCLAAELDGRILGWQGAAGSRIADVEITNTGGSCRVRGTPGLQLVDAGGRGLIDSTTAGPSGEPHLAPSDPTFDLVQGARLRTEVEVSDYCGPAPTLPIDIAFTLPADGGRFVAKPGQGVASDMAVPPCEGSTGGAISMNGWRR